MFDHYRVSVRTIWNTAFWPDADFRNWDSIDEFHKIEKILFDQLVLAKVDREWLSCDLFVRIKPGQAELQLIAYFDWNQMDYIDLRYYRVKIASVDAPSELVGREALIERQHGTVHLTNESGSQAARADKSPDKQYGFPGKWSARQPTACA